MKKRITGLITACLILCLGAAVHASAAALTFNRESLVLSVGRYVTIGTEVVPSGAMPDSVTYSVSDDSVASVDQNGKVRGLSAGECELTATSDYDETISVSIPLIIIVPVTDVDITAAEHGVVLGKTLQLSVAVTPSDATMQAIAFSSSDESVLTVTQDGLVTGVSRGEASVTAESADGRATDRFRITVKQPPESVAVSPETVTVAEGKTQKLTATVLPKDTNDKTVYWTSADESVAAVSSRGAVTGVALGQTVITATCKDNPDVTFDIPVTVLRLASSVTFNQDNYKVEVGDTVQLTHTVYPTNTSNQAVTCKVRNSKIATVDENGVVTALKGGTTTVIVTTADGSRKSATATITVPIHVTGVSYSYSDIRVGENHYGHFTVKLKPSDATNNAMTWVTGDESIATVTGDTNTFKLVGGDTWGRTTVTGTTEDGGYTITLNANIGSLYNAITVQNLSIYNGKPYITLQNNSGMVISQVRYFMQGLNSSQQPIEMSTTGDLLTLYGTYDLPLSPGEWTQHGLFTFYAPSDYPDLKYLFIVITGWSTSTGYYNSYGNLQYIYSIPENDQELVVYPEGSDPSLYQSNG